MRILVVDDEPDILELVQYNLTREHYEVVCVASGEEALVQVYAAPPDLIVLDLMLPGVNGLEVCRALKRHPGTAVIPVVMLTARGEEADIVAGLELGAADYLTKPFSPCALLARMRAVLRRQQSELVAADACATPHVSCSCVFWDVRCIQNTQEHFFFQVISRDAAPLESCSPVTFEHYVA